MDGCPAREMGRDRLANLQKELVWVLIQARILKMEFVQSGCAAVVQVRILFLTCACRSLLCKDSLVNSFCAETINAAPAFIAGRTSRCKRSALRHGRIRHSQSADALHSFDCGDSG